MNEATKRAIDHIPAPAGAVPLPSGKRARIDEGTFGRGRGAGDGGPISLPPPATAACGPRAHAGAGKHPPAPPLPGNRPGPAFPSTYRKYQPNAGSYPGNPLDVAFFHLNDWIFHGRQSVSLHLFQAGRKQNFGFMDDGFTTMYLPARPDGLADWLECFDRGASIKPAGVETDGYAHYTWQSVVALPRAKLTQHLVEKYKSSERRGFRDAPIVEGHASRGRRPAADPEGMFPKIAALAGLRRDDRVKKGWISFVLRGGRWSLAICRGNTRDPGKSKARPRGLAFEGEGQHDPEGGPLLRVSGGTEIRGLHDLFCVVEGLLRTL